MSLYKHDDAINKLGAEQAELRSTSSNINCQKNVILRQKFINIFSTRLTGRDSRYFRCYYKEMKLRFVIQDAIAIDEIYNALFSLTYIDIKWNFIVTERR